MDRLLLGDWLMMVDLKVLSAHSGLVAVLNCASQAHPNAQSGGRACDELII